MDTETHLREAEKATRDAQKKALGQRMREAREQAGMTNGARFARSIGVDPTTLYRYEGGHVLPSAFVLGRVAEATGADLGWIIAGDESLLGGEAA